MNNKLPEYDPWTGETNPLLDAVRRKEKELEEEFGKFGKSSSRNARFEGTHHSFTPEDATEMILDFLSEELPITSRYIDEEMVMEWITKRYGL